MSMKVKSGLVLDRGAFPSARPELSNNRRMCKKHKRDSKKKEEIAKFSSVQFTLHGLDKSA